MNWVVAAGQGLHRDPAPVGTCTNMRLQIPQNNPKVNKSPNTASTWSRSVCVKEILMGGRKTVTSPEKNEFGARCVGCRISVSILAFSPLWCHKGMPKSYRVDCLANVQRLQQREAETKHCSGKLLAQG